MRIFLAILLVLIVWDKVSGQSQVPRIAVSAPEVDQYKPRGTSKIFVALFGLHIDVTTKDSSNTAKRAGAYIFEIKYLFDNFKIAKFIS
jgi:hypothetical protein